MGLFFINAAIRTKNRFDVENFIDYSNDNFDLLTSEFVKQLKIITPKGRYIVQGNATRPDNISYKIYGDTQYWWILLIYNNILDVADINEGDLINYVSINDLETIYFSLKQKERVN